MKPIQTNPGHPSSSAAVGGAERADDRFFAALLAADGDQLETLLADDFVIIDVLRGDVINRAGLIGSVGSGLIRFRVVELVERATRRHGDTAIIVGRTRMAGSFDGAPFNAASRYTHVLTRGQDGSWQIVNAQGTPIRDGQPW